jgi:hypothetical protein
LPGKQLCLIDGLSGRSVSLLVVLFVTSLGALLGWFAYFLSDAAPPSSGGPPRPRV